LRLARAPGRVRIGGIGTTIADPAVGASPNQGQLSTGDTLRVLLRGNTNSTAVQGMQLFVNLDSTKFALVDQDQGTAGVQPFGFNSSYFLGSVPALINRVALSGDTYKLDLDKRNLSGPADPTGMVIAHVDLVARDFSGSASVYWSDDRVNDPNRVSLFFNADGLLGVAFVNPLASFTSISRGSISGFVPLQGLERTTDSKLTTFWLRTPGSWISIGDTVFVNANDDSTTMEGVQQTTGSDGSFTLTKVPAGTYELVAKSESYLAGYAPVSVVNGQLVTGVVPTSVATGDDPGELVGGDVSGDNKIDADDESALNLAYEAATGDSNFDSAADIDDDGMVRLSDLLILSANMRSPMLTGVAPVYKPNAGAALVLNDVPLSVEAGEVFQVAVQLENAAAFTAYSLALEFDPATVRVLSVETPLLSTTSAIRIHRRVRPGRHVLAQAIRGGADVPFTGADLATVRLEALTAVQPELNLVDAVLGFSGGAQEILAARTVVARPERFSLWPNTPNPFNPETHIAFDLPQDGVRVQLTVFNAMGQAVRQLVDAPAMGAGRYGYTWDGRDDAGIQVSSGVYLFRLRAGGFVSTRKMLLMK
jgi:hypothetical protein